MNEPIFLKIIVVGDSGVGKTSFLNRYCYGSFNIIQNPTIGCDFQMKILTNYEGRSLRLQLWDIAGTLTSASIIIIILTVVFQTQARRGSIPFQSFMSEGLLDA